MFLNKEALARFLCKESDKTLIVVRLDATESGNYLDMLPGSVNLYRGGMHVMFNDENGISMSSNTSLNIGTPAGISMSAGSVSISGSNKLIVSKSKGGFISLEGDLYNEASVVYENGSCRELFAPFTDDVPDLGELLAIQSQINLNKFNPNGDLVSAMAGAMPKVNGIPNLFVNDNLNKFNPAGNPKLAARMTTPEGIPLTGEALKNCNEVGYFNSSGQCKEGGLYKIESQDGNYDLVVGHNTTITSSGYKSEYRPYNKQIYNQHNDVKKSLESTGLAIVNFGQKTLGGLGIADSYIKQYITPWGRFIPNTTWNESRDFIDATSEKTHNYLRDKAPYKKTFDISEFTCEVIYAVSGAIGLAKDAMEVPNIIRNLRSGIKITQGAEKTIELPFKITSWEAADGVIAPVLKNPIIKIPSIPKLALAPEMDVAISATGIGAIEIGANGAIAVTGISNIVGGNGGGDRDYIETIPPDKLLGIEHEKIKNPRESLNDKIPRSKLAKTPQRRLTKEEKRIANQHLDDLVAKRNGDQIARERLTKYREHPLQDLRNIGGDNYQGWTSLDLSETNDSSNIMRLIYRETQDGIEWKIIQQH